MLSIEIICIGKIKENDLKGLCNEYSKRLSRYIKLNILELPDLKIPDKSNSNIENDIKTKECNNILNHIKKDSYVFALDLNGKQFSSTEFADKFSSLSLTNSHITFIIGGSLGLNNQLLSNCNEKICFSRMTFPHQLIRVFLLEQIFRAFKINNNETYHK